MDRVIPVEEVFKQWKKYNRMIENINKTYCGNTFIYEEAMNESFFWVKKALENYNDKKNTKFSTYLFETLRRYSSRFSATYLRHKKISQCSIFSDNYSTYDELTWTNENGTIEEKFCAKGKNIDIDLDTYLAVREIKKYIKRMPPEARRIFDIIYGMDMKKEITDVECAKILKKPISTVRNNKYTALNFLKKNIECKAKWIKELLEDM